MTIEPADPSGGSASPPTRRPGGAGPWLLGAWVGTLVALLIVFAWLLGKDEGERQAERTPVTAQQPAEPEAGDKAAETPAEPEDPGRQTFVASCGGCHVLAEAGTSSPVGPNLDDLKPDAARVQAAIATGGTGTGAMPAGLLEGDEAQQVAEYVAKVAGG